MCLAVPGKIIEINKENGIKMGKVDFDGIIIRVCLETTPEAKVSDYVIVHAGFAINTLNEQEALETLEMLKEIDKIQSDITG
jgi:hydrogenase expression/formation protein HypC